jgi:ribosomal protein S27AE
MQQLQFIEVEEEEIVEEIRLKSTERDCPGCDAVLVLNENEQCYECLNCGYIDCGDED